MEDCFNTTFYDHADYIFATEPNSVGCLNGSRNATEGPTEDDVAVTVIVGIVLGLLILVTVVGNVFVLAAIYMEKNLRGLQNYLICSLAVADLMVACLVMPLGAVYEISKTWPLGKWWCLTWTSSDVLSCTASILHLVAIALDRYWAVTDIDYIHRRDKSRVCVMILAVWLVAGVIMSAQIAWKDETWDVRISNQECTVNQDKYFQVFATLSSFYVPLAVILFFYWKIFQAARKRIRKRRPPPATSLLPRPAAETSLITQASSSNPSPERSVLLNNCGGVRGEAAEDGASSTAADTPRRSIHHQLLPPSSPGNSSAGMTPEATPARKVRTPRESGESKRERKAAKTLGIITGAFIVCWLPFFIMAITLPLCGDACYISRPVVSLIQWLGFFNSTLNPCIYTVFNPEFRAAFKKILFGKQRKSNRAVAV